LEHSICHPFFMLVGYYSLACMHIGSRICWTSSWPIIEGSAACTAGSSMLIFVIIPAASRAGTQGIINISTSIVCACMHAWSALGVSAARGTRHTGPKTICPSND